MSLLRPFKATEVSCCSGLASHISRSGISTKQNKLITNLLAALAGQKTFGMSFPFSCGTVDQQQRRRINSQTAMSGEGFDLLIDQCGKNALQPPSPSLLQCI
jgi:hypothetical protein